MVNLKGRPTKYEDRKTTHFSASIPEHFEKTWPAFVERCKTYNSKKFITYCNIIEDEDVSERKQGRVSKVLRFLVTSFMKNDMKGLGDNE